MGCKPKNTSGCIKDKYIQYLNDKFPQLPFEFGCVLDEAFQKIIKESNMKCMYECDSTGTTFFTHIDGDGIRTEWTDSTMTVPYVSQGTLKPAPTDRIQPSCDIEILEAEDQNGVCVWVEHVKGFDADGLPLRTIKYFDSAALITELEVTDLALPLKTKQPEVIQFEEIDGAKETIKVSDEEPVTLPNIPEGATGARVQVHSGCVRACSDGTVPTVDTGFRFGDTGRFVLGCVSNDTLGADTDQLENFQVIAEAGETATLTVTYFEKV